MRIELAIYVTTFALVSASILFSGRRELRSNAVRERKNAAELDALLRPMLLFSATAPVAHC
ncbi:hypothetical protein F0U60_33930 [Archangium minus]|uniref:Uncharacterized protein n=1 Tax=Archangium minus TaxID=83450 RepID=A0ABY9WZK8_9BACT|nr:hypothetical protein F0U61_34055 [Archangium violaceum]WNG48565.1 hypothetical protein F0U60_33930 [Archangium minus]